MEDLVLVKKMSRAEVVKNARMGRPIRETFALRHYANACIIAIPSSVCADKDRAEFYLSKVGFAIRISPDGSRAISGRKSARSASIPLEIRDTLSGVTMGTHELITDPRSDGLYFFPFSQLPKS